MNTNEIAAAAVAKMDTAQLVLLARHEPRRRHVLPWWWAVTWCPFHTRLVSREHPCLRVYDWPLQSDKENGTPLVSEAPSSKREATSSQACQRKHSA